MSEQSTDVFDEHKRRVTYTTFAVFAGIAAAVLLIGLSLTWFVESKKQSTVGQVQGPAEIKVLGPNATAMEEIDLAYEPTEFIDHKVKLTRTFSVVSGASGFKLYIAYTTNISDLDIKLYRVDDQKGSANADVVELDGDGNKYAWNRRGGEATDTEAKGNLFPSNGVFINPKDSDNKLAKDLNSQIFNGASAQDNAIPLYWEYSVDSGYTDTKTSKYKDSSGNDCALTNFIIDLSWTDSSKETDVLYLIARS